MFDDIALFIHIAQHQGLAPAAAQLNLPPATVTRRLQKLEEHLGCKLIHRSARRFNLTAEGRAYFEAYSGLVAQMETTAQRLSKDMHQLSGSLTVTAPTNISLGILNPMWTGFIKAYPDIQLNLKLSNSLADLEGGQVDMALRIGPLKDSDLYQKRLGAIATVMVTAPSYSEAHGFPERLEDLDQHRLITVPPLLSWPLRHRETGAVTPYHPRPQTLVNDIQMARSFAEEGLGIALLPLTEVHPSLRAGRLVTLLPDWQGPVREIAAVWPSGRLLSAKAKALRDYMADFMAKDPRFGGAKPDDLGSKAYSAG